MKKALILACFSVLLAIAAHAQGQFDVSFGAGTTLTPTTDGSGPLNVNGGTFPVFSGDFLFLKNFGVGGEVAWRASHSDYVTTFDTQPYRPIFYSFYAIYAPPLGSKRVTGELLAGIGAQSTRFYQPFTTCDFSCTNYVSSNHFAGEFGGGLRFYVKNNVFIRPEVRYYIVNNNEEFNTGHIVRTGVSIGYTFRPGD